LKLSHIDLRTVHPSNHLLHLHIRITEELLEIFHSSLEDFGLHNLSQGYTLAARGLV
jgi:hypothetical protein